MLTYLFYFLLAYSLYQLIFRFILPIYRTTRQVKKGFREMQERMQEHGAAPSSRTQKNNANVRTSKEQEGDYIDFEEVKE
jgi:hypothetical protein